MGTKRSTPRRVLQWNDLAARDLHEATAASDRGRLRGLALTHLKQAMHAFEALARLEESGTSSANFTVLRTLLYGDREFKAELAKVANGLARPAVGLVRQMIVPSPETGTAVQLVVPDHIGRAAPRPSRVVEQLCAIFEVALRPGDTEPADNGELFTVLSGVLGGQLPDQARPRFEALMGMAGDREHVVRALLRDAGWSDNKIKSAFSRRDKEGKRVKA